jgi:hypothetical protein
MNDKSFTVADAIKIQQQQLLQWKSVLKSKKYELLCKHADVMNADVVDAYNVFRGVDICMYIQNALMDN